MLRLLGEVSFNVGMLHQESARLFHFLQIISNNVSIHATLYSEFYSFFLLHHIQIFKPDKVWNFNSVLKIDFARICSILLVILACGNF